MQIRYAAFEYYERLRKVKAFVETHFAEEILLKQAAAIACMEKSSFCTFFRRKVGITFQQWLAHFRVSRAMDHLRTKDFSILEVSEAVGFKDVRTFQRAFKRFGGRPPFEFKRSVRPDADQVDVG
jgi:transcriptional regulator GlxA family with amidase domain